LWVVFEKYQWEFDFILAWFLGSLIPLEIIISNPGTHVHNYYIPIYIASGFGIYKIYEFIRSERGKYIFSIIVGILLIIVTIISFYVYTPVFNKGYPWKESDLFGISFNPPLKDKYHLYLYGFPYNRGWNEIEDFMRSQKNVEGVYTNDNDTIAEYYLLGFNYTIPGSNFIPQYFISVYKNQQFVTEEESFYVDYKDAYENIKEISVDEELVAKIYKRKEAYQPFD